MSSLSTPPATAAKPAAVATSATAKTGSEKSAASGKSAKTSSSSTTKATSTKHKRTWEESFEALKRYKAKHGNCLVPIHNYAPDLALGGWVNHQRSRRYKLTQEQRDKLDSVGFTWVVRQRNQHWNSMTDKLQMYQKEHGHGNVPLDHAEDPELAKFVENCRLQYTRGQLSMSRQAQLELLGLDFDNGNNEESDSSDDEGSSSEEEEEDDMIVNDDDFDAMYDKLILFHAEYGHANVPNNKSHKTLYQWVSMLRRQYAISKVDDECKEMLNDLQFEWKSSGDDYVSDRESKASVREKGKSTSSGADKDDESKKEQNSHDAEATSDADSSGQEDEETSIKEQGHNSKPKANIVSSKGNHLDDDVSQAPTESEDDSDESEKAAKSATTLVRKPFQISMLAPFAASRVAGAGPKRKSGMRGFALPTQKRRRLSTETATSTNTASSNCNISSENENESEAVGRLDHGNSDTSTHASSKKWTWKGARDERFMHHYENLLKFKQKYGHTRVPQSNAEFKTLGGWVNNLRVAYNRDPVNGIPRDRLKLLEDAGMIWDASGERPGNEARWESNFNELQKFLQKYGHCRVPQGPGPYRKLGRWVATQRVMHNRDPVNGLKPDRLQRLNAVGFCWNAKVFKGRHFYTSTSNQAEVSTDGSVVQGSNNQEALNYSGDETELDDDDLMDDYDDGRFEDNEEDVTAHVITSSCGEDNDDAFMTDRSVPDGFSALLIATAVEEKKRADPASEFNQCGLGWDNYFLQLVEFYNRHGHFRIPDASKSSNNSSNSSENMKTAGAASNDNNYHLLHLWAKVQQQQYSGHEDTNIKHTWDQSKVSKYNRLKALGFLEEGANSGVGPGSTAWSKKQYWNEQFEKLIRVHEQDPDYNIAVEKEDEELVTFFQRLRKNKSRLSARRLQRLKDIGFDWFPTEPEVSVSGNTSGGGSNTAKCSAREKNSNRQHFNDAKWERSYEQLLNFRLKHGHVRVPQSASDADIRRLGKWCCTQRLLYKKDPVNGIRPDRFQKLQDVGFVWNVTRKGNTTNHGASTSSGNEDSTPQDQAQTRTDAEDASIAKPVAVMSAAAALTNDATIATKPVTQPPVMTKACRLPERVVSASTCSSSSPSLEAAYPGSNSVGSTPFAVPHQRSSSITGASRLPTLSNRQLPMVKQRGKLPLAKAAPVE